jgi:hypothetical protein
MVNDLPGDNPVFLKTVKNEPTMPGVVSRVDNEQYVAAGSAGDFAWARKIKS